MPDFWLATYDVVPTAPPTGSPAEPLIAEGASVIAVEVIRQGDELAVLFSSAGDATDPQPLACRIGFANGAKACSVWRERGFPLVDADIRYENGQVKVVSSYFGDDKSMRYGGLLVVIDGVDFGPAAKPDDKLTAHYEQWEEAPDPVAPADVLLRRRLRWKPMRLNVKSAYPAAVKFEVTKSRSPSLQPVASPALRAARAWSGLIEVLPTEPDIVDDPPKRASRADIFGVPAFRFEDVEVIGFRLDLEKTPEVDAGLAELIEPLNFHLLRPGGGRRSADFRYRSASRMVLVELLRYGRMQLQAQDAPLTQRDYQSQHELVVRLVVGRVDDDAAQAQDGAVYVPAIFVDNAWSKMLGRDVQGFDKRMAQFCIIKDDRHFLPLRPDGRMAVGDDEPASLSSIASINVVERTASGGAREDRQLISLDYLSEPDESWEDFQRVNLGLAFGGIPGTRWRQSDFDQAEFRRSFALSAMADSVRGFRSIQVSPVGKRRPAMKKLLEEALITSTFTIDDGLRVAYPRGGVRLCFNASPAAPSSWRKFCGLLGTDNGVATRVFQTGSWYRLRFSMDMTVRNGLEWG